MKFVLSVDPAYDREVSRYGVFVVLYRDKDSIKLLTYDDSDNTWFITRYPSNTSSEGKELPGADFYYENIGYIYDSVGFAAFDEDTGLDIWEQIYSAER